MGITRSSYLLPFFAVLINLGILLYLAATTTMWYGEVDSFFLSRLPLAEMLDPMSSNYDQDAAAFNLLQQFWQIIVDYNLFLLRLLPLVFGLHLWLALDYWSAD